MKRNIKITAISLVILSAVYSGAWKYYSVQFRKHIEEQLADINNRGFEVSFDYARVSGFPFGFDVKVKNLDVQRADVFHTWVDGTTKFSVKIWKPQEVSATTDGPHHLEVDEFKSVGNGLVILSFVFDPMRMNCVYDNINITAKEQPYMAGKQVDLDVDLTPIDATEAATIKFRAFEWDVALLKEHPLGDKFQNVSFSTSLKGAPHGDTLQHMARNWFEEDGVLDVHEIAFRWGKVSLSGNGSIVLDEKLQPMAAFSLKISKLNEGIEAFKLVGKIEKRTADMLKVAAGLLSNSDACNISLSVQNQKLYVASIPLLKIPEIQW